MRVRNLRNLYVAKIRGFEDFLNFPRGTNIPLNEHAYKELGEVLEILNVLHIKYWVADGTLLGFYRDKCLIPHDTDIDFYTLNCDKFTELKSAMHDSGYDLGRDMKKFGFQFQLTFISPTGNLIDFCNWRSDGSNFVEFYAPEISFPRKQPLEFYVRNESYTISNLEYTSFFEVEKWLRMMYGETWSIPEVTKLDWREHVKDR